MDSSNLNAGENVVLQGRLVNGVDLPKVLKQIAEQCQSGRVALIIDDPQVAGTMLIENGQQIIDAKTSPDNSRGMRALVKLFSASKGDYRVVAVDQADNTDAGIRLSIDRLFEHLERAMETAQAEAELQAAEEAAQSSSGEQAPQDMMSAVQAVMKQRRANQTPPVISVDAFLASKPPPPVEEAPKGPAPWLIAAAVVAVILFGALVLQTVTAFSSKSHLDAGIDALKKGSADLAEREFSACLQTDPHLVKALLLRAIAYGRLGETEKAIADYTDVLLHDQREKSALIGRACQYLKAKDYEKAAADCDSALSLDPSLGDAYRVRAIAESQDANYDKAVADCKQYLKLVGDTAPKNERADIYAVLAQARLKDDEFGAAIEDYTTAIKLDPESAALYRGRALAFKTAGDWANALKDANEAIKRASTAELYQLRSRCYQARGNYAASLSDARKAISLDAGNPLLYKQEGDLLILTSHFAEAATRYRKALDLSPNDPVLRARYDLAVGKAPNAAGNVLADLQSEPGAPAVNKYHGDAQTLTNTGYELMQKGQNGEAVLALSAALKADANNQQARQYLAHALMLAGKNVESAQQFAHLEKLRSLDPRDLESYGKVLEQSNQTQKAISAYQRCLAADPANHAVRLCLIELLLAHGEASQAQKLAAEGLSKASDPQRRQAYQQKLKDIATPRSTQSASDAPS